MKGLYILAILAVALLVLGYLVMKPTDSDLRRKYDRLLMGRERLEEELKSLEEPLAFLRSQKRTIKLEKEYDVLRKGASDVRVKLNVALYNVENLSDATRKAVEEVLADLEKDLNKWLSSASHYGRKVRALNGFVKEGFPLRNRLIQLQQRMNAAAEGRALPKETLADLESYNVKCEQIVEWSQQAMTTLHTDMEQGEILTGTALNEMRKLLPSLEAFVEGLEKKP